MKAALLNAHTSYAEGASGIVDGTTLTEYRLSSKINNELQTLLKKYSIDSYIVDGSTVSPYSGSLRHKTVTVNANPTTNIAIETHFNSSANTATATFSSGLEVLYNGNINGSKELAVCMVEGLKHCLPFKIRRDGTGIWERTNLYLLKFITVPVIIIEVCFLSHYKDRLFLIQPRAIEVIAIGIADGIKSYGIKRGLING